MYDHIDFALTSLDMFSGISENLINYAFNVSAHFYWFWCYISHAMQMASYEMNTVMYGLNMVHSELT